MDKKPARFSSSYYYSYFRLNKIVSVLVLTFLMTLIIGTYIVIKPFLTKGQQTISNASLRLPATATTITNQLITLPLVVDTDTQNIYGVDAVIGFDTTKVRVIDVDPVASSSTTLKQFLPLTSTVFDKQKVISDANATGLLKFSGVTFDQNTQSPTTPFNGNTVLANLTFQPLIAGTTSISILADTGSTIDSNIALASNPPEDVLQRTDQVTSTLLTISSSSISGTLTPTSTMVQTQTPTPTNVFSTPTLTPTVLPSLTPTPTNTANGLIGTYFNTKYLSAEVFKRVDSEINFNWGSGSPDASINANTFSIRWTGFVLPQSSGTYTFYVTADDGVRLWVNNQQLVNQWNDHSAKEFSGKITLSGGLKIPLKLEYYENKGKARIELRWSGPGIAKQILESTNLISQ